MKKKEKRNTIIFKYDKNSKIEAIIMQKPNFHKSRKEKNNTGINTVILGN